MLTSFSTALSGLNADTTAIDIVGNDLANLNTTGFKATDISFKDLVSQSTGGATSSTQVGTGVSQVIGLANYSQGSVQTTKGPLDCAIQGNGFFVATNSQGGTEYTRDGSFSLNTNGSLVTATGELVQGWTAANGTVNTNSPIGNISLPLSTAVPASATTTMSVSANLDSRVATSDPGAVFTAPVKVVDSLGTSHTLSVTYTKTASNTWTYAVTVPATDLASGGVTNLATGTLSFDASGNLTSPAVAAGQIPLAVNGLADGAANMNVTWNLYSPTGAPSVTQFATATGTSSIVQNGNEAGQIANVSMQPGGLLVANYSNGEQVTLGQLAIASIDNPASLTAVGNNMLQVSSTTAPPAIGTANSGARGQVETGVLESSTVDIAQEFTNLLTFQRSYQADSKVITTSDQLVQATLSLIQG
jgi:flagellar hook protein FlgE